MFGQYFGQYLLQKRIITPEALLEVLEYQKTVNLKLGLLAVNAGLMTPVQVETVHHAQRQRDQKFGEIAIEFGFLTPGQLEELLRTQKRGHLLISQALIDKNILTLQELESALKSFKDTGMSSQMENLQSADIDALVRNAIDLGSDAETSYDYIALMLRNVIRFLGEEPVIVPGLPAIDGAPRTIIQEVSGEIKLITGLIMSEEAFIGLARRFSGEVIEEINELADAAVGEFLNLHNGLFLVNMSNRGIELQLSPQKVVTGLQSHQPGEIISLGLTLGNIGFLFRKNATL
ncbi:MAG: chemotaxis protein CheX [Bacillota bacterium]